MHTINKQLSPLETELRNYFNESRDEIFSTGNEKLNQFREDSFTHFVSSGLPATQDEKWRNSMLPANYEKSFSLSRKPSTYSKTAGEIFECEIHGYSAHILSMLNGWYYSPEPDTMLEIQKGVVAGSILAAQKNYPDLFEKHFGKFFFHFTCYH